MRGYFEVGVEAQRGRDGLVFRVLARVVSGLSHPRSTVLVPHKALPEKSSLDHKEPLPTRSGSSLTRQPRHALPQPTPPCYNPSRIGTSRLEFIPGKGERKGWRTQGNTPQHPYNPSRPIAIRIVSPHHTSSLILNSNRRQLPVRPFYANIQTLWLIFERETTTSKNALNSMSHYL